MRQRARKPLSEYNLSNNRARWNARRAGYDVPLLPKKSFWDRVVKSDGCWEWTGRLGGGGYGTCKVDGVRMGAHRYAWIESNGPIPEGLFACHHCDNRKCVRPSHLFIGTQADNVRDCVTKGRNPGNRKLRGWRLTVRRDQVQLAIELFDEGRLSLRGIARQVGINYAAVRSIVLESRDA